MPLSDTAPLKSDRVHIRQHQVSSQHAAFAADHNAAPGAVADAMSKASAAIDRRPRTYLIRHLTLYQYAAQASLSRQVLRLGPRDVLGEQTVSRRDVTIEPSPVREQPRTDAFGNPAVNVVLEASHTELRLDCTGVVQVDRNPVPDPNATLAWDAVFDRVRGIVDPGDLEAMDVAFPTIFTEHNDKLTAYGELCFPAGRPILIGAIALCTRVFEDFTYDGSATTVSTPASVAFDRRRGVCQDFAHVMLACFRALGLPARYVSGYLLTHPPPGKPKLRGVDASHAWVSVYVPFADGTTPSVWVDLDPTNGMIVGNEHITAAWGRDYADVAPVTGVVTGGGMQSVAVDVDVEETPSPPPAEG